MSGELLVETGQGPARWVLDGERAATTVLALGHGAGGGVEAPDLAELACRLPEHGVLVARFEQPWRAAGRRVAPAPARLDEAWRQALPLLRASVPARRLVVGGRSAGARVACRTAGALGAAAVLALSFPLHPPGRPEASRAPEAADAGVPLLVVQGSRDPFGGAGEVREALAGVPSCRVLEAVDCGHELVPARRSGLDVPTLWEGMVDGVARFVLGSDPE